MRRFLWLSLGALALAGIAGASSGGGTRADARWVITDLGTLGGEGSYAGGINDLGAVVGWAGTKERETSGQEIAHAFLWDKGKMRDLGTLGGRSSGASAINNSGQVVGSADTKKYEQTGFERYYVWHAFLWQDGKMRDLGTLPGMKYSEAHDINEEGQVVGSSGQRAFLWQGGRMVELRGLGGPSNALAINDRGQILGTSATKSGRDNLVLWEHGRMRIVHPLTRGMCGDELAFNDQGQIVVTLLTGTLVRVDEYEPEHICHGYLWQGGTLRDLGLAPRNLNSDSRAINDQGQIVGSADRELTVPQAVVWEEWKTTRLPVLGRSDRFGRSEAWGINERGQIVGYSVNKTGDTHAVLWTPKR